MAKIKLGNIDPRSIPVVRGSFYITDNAHGPVARKWPKKQSRPTTAVQRYHQWEFTIIATYAANPYDIDYGTAVEMVKGTEFVPRDFLMLTAYGKAYEFPMPDGSPFKSFRMTVPNPQPILDLVTDVPGSLLWRSGIGWEGLLPGSNGWVLTSDAGGIRWLPPSGGGVAGSVKLVPPSDVTSAAGTNTIINAISGSEVVMYGGQVVNGIAVYCRVASPTTVLEPALYDNVANVPVNRVAKGAAVTGLTVGWNLLPFDAEYTALQFDQYYPCVRTSGAVWQQGNTNSVSPGWSVASAVPPPATLGAVARSFGNTNAHCFLYNL